MGGDYTRFTFDPRKGYNAVLRQQGRVAVDADRNEAAEIGDRHWRSETYDLLSVEDGGPAGLCVVPRSNPDAFLVLPGGGTFALGVGRAYVDGIQVESFGDAGGGEAWSTVLAELVGTDPTPYDEQPYLSSHADHPHLPAPPPLPQGPYVVYLDVWYREVDFLADPEIREKALGGPDHGTRVQTVWQVRALDLGDGGGDVRCDDDLEAWDELTAPSAGRLTTSTEAPQPGENPCILSPEGGYRGRENRLYRVEIHAVAEDGAATWKWSRDNASVNAAVSAVAPVAVTLEDAFNNPVAVNVHRLTVSSLGRDDVLRFVVGGWVEVRDEHVDLEPGRAGVLARVVAIDEAERWMTLDRELPAADYDLADPASRRTRVVRWDQTVVIADESAAPQGALDVQLGVPVALEDGVVVELDLDPAAGRFRVGDHWLFAARTADSSVEPLAAAPPRGIHHHYARLGVVEAGVLVADCREPWPRDGGEAEACCTVVVHPGESVQAAIEALPPEGGCVCLKAGEHEIEAPVVIGRSDVHLHGESPGARVVRRDGNAALLVVRGAADVVVETVEWLAELGQRPGGAQPLARIERSARVSLRHCRFAVARPPQTTVMSGLTGIEVESGEDVRVEGCAIVGVSAGVIAFSGLRLTVEDCELVAEQLGVPGAGFLHGEIGVSTSCSGRSRIRDNRFQGYQAAVVVAAPAAGSLVEANRVERMALPASDDGEKSFAIRVAARGTVVCDNLIAVPGPGQGGIHLAAGQARAERNWIGSEARDGRGLPIGVLVEETLPLVGPGATGVSDFGWMFLEMEEPLLVVGVEATAAGPAAAFTALGAKARGDGVVVADNTIHGPLNGVVVRGTRGTVVRGNQLDALAATEGVGVTLEDALEARVAANRIERFAGGVHLRNGEANEVEDNGLFGGDTGVSAEGELDLRVAGNEIEDAAVGGCTGLGLARTATFTHNRLLRCGWHGGKTGVGTGIAVLFAVGEAVVRDCHVLDTGVAPDGQQRTAEQALGIALLVTIYSKVEGNTVAYTRLTDQDPGREDRALVLHGWWGLLVFRDDRRRPAIAIGSALVLGNQLSGPGRSALVEVVRFEVPVGRFALGLIFDRVTFSGNHCEHLVSDRDDSRATVRLHGGEMVVMGNHVKGTSDGVLPSPFFSFDFNQHPRVALTGNVSTGAYLQLGGSVPAPDQNFNIRP